MEAKGRKYYYLYLFIMPPVIVFVGVYFLERNQSSVDNVRQSQEVVQKKQSKQVLSLPKEIPSLEKEVSALEKPKTAKVISKSRPIPESQPIANYKKFPKNIKEVKMTEKLMQAIEEERQRDQPDIFERLDYRLRFFALFSSCIGNNQPPPGEMLIHLLFLADLDKMIAVGVGPDKVAQEGAIEAFNIRQSNFDETNESIIVSCVIESHEGKELDMKNTSLSLDDLRRVKMFYFPTYIRFPLEENDVYWFIEHDGEHYSESRISR